MTTPEFRVSYPSVFKPKFNDLSEKNEYVVDALFEKKKTDIKAFQKIINAAIELQWNGKPPKKLRTPIKDGDEMENPEYAGHWVMTFKANENYPPTVIGTKRGPDGVFVRLTEKEFYGGCYARATINAYAYDMTANKGVSFGLGNIQKLRDGERFGGGGGNADDEFADIAEEIDDGDFGAEQENDW
jgi:hypothetical protein